MASLRQSRASYTFKHPILGSMTGAIAPDADDVVQFRAIPYATLPARFQHSIFRENLEDTNRDFTNIGFACPHTFSMDDIHSGGLYPNEEPIKTSEFESLILQVNVPLAQLEAFNSDVPHKSTPRKLPVMTYIHGGGFMLGKIDAHHNTAYIVQHSITKSQPVIAVSVQYRLGALGFLATPDGKKNLALYDQRNALLWIQKFIEGFGGDREQITVFGESAGGYSICSHMLSHLPPSGPLFNRAIIMSGIIGPMVAPISQANADNVFAKILQQLGIEEKGEAAMEKLRSLNVQKIVDASDAWTSQGKSWSPVQDASFFCESDISWDRIPELLEGCEWVDEIIVGNTGFEGAVCLSLANSMTPQLFHDHMVEQLSPESAEQIIKLYGVTLNMDQNQFLTAAMRWFGEVYFDAPIDAFCRHMAKNAEKRIYRYVFNVRNPFPNAPFYQQAHHWVDVYFVFRTMQFRFLQNYHKEISDRHAHLWIDFAHGNAPWSAHKQGQEAVIVADEQEVWIECSPTRLEEVSDVDLERLKKLWEIWGEKKGQYFLPLNLAALRQAKQ